MKNLLQNLRAFGASSATVNFILTIFSLFIFLLGLGLIAVLVIESVQGKELSSSIIAILTAITIASAGLITVSHTTNQINGTAAQSAQVASEVASKNALDMASIVQQVVNANLAVQKQADTHATDMQRGQNISTDANTVATEQNTIATDKATKEQAS